MVREYVTKKNALGNTACACTLIARLIVKVEGAQPVPKFRVYMFVFDIKWDMILLI